MVSLFLNSLIFVLAMTGVANAAADAGGSQNSFLFVLFVGFCSLIILFQLVPAVLLFVGMVKGLFGRADNENGSLGHSTDGQ